LCSTEHRRTVELAAAAPLTAVPVARGAESRAPALVAARTAEPASIAQAVAAQMVATLPTQAPAAAAQAVVSRAAARVPEAAAPMPPSMSLSTDHATPRHSCRWERHVPRAPTAPRVLARQTPPERAKSVVRAPVRMPVRPARATAPRARPRTRESLTPRVEPRQVVTPAPAPAGVLASWHRLAPTVEASSTARRPANARVRLACPARLRMFAR
jgi:hypothetical protein